MDLSKATGLKRVVLVCRSADPKWITVTLRSITDDHKHLQQIILDASCMLDILDILWPDRVTPAEVRLEIGKPAYREWIKLTALSVGSWSTLHPIEGPIRGTRTVF